LYAQYTLLLYYFVCTIHSILCTLTPYPVVADRKLDQEPLLGYSVNLRTVKRRRFVDNTVHEEDASAEEESVDNENAVVDGGEANLDVDMEDAPVEEGEEDRENAAVRKNERNVYGSLFDDEAELTDGDSETDADDEISEAGREDDRYLGTDDTALDDREDDCEDGVDLDRYMDTDEDEDAEGDSTPINSRAQHSQRILDYLLLAEDDEYDEYDEGDEGDEGDKGDEGDEGDEGAEGEEDLDEAGDSDSYLDTDDDGDSDDDDDGDDDDDDDDDGGADSPPRVWSQRFRTTRLRRLC
jgi:hypothetical protein